MCRGKQGRVFYLKFELRSVYYRVLESFNPLLWLILLSDDFGRDEEASFRLLISKIGLFYLFLFFFVKHFLAGNSP